MTRTPTLTRIGLAAASALLLTLTAAPADAQRWGRPRPPRAGACF